MVFLQVYLVAMVALTAVQACEEHPECPPLWSRYGANCYRFFGQAKTWQAAEEHCQAFFSLSGQGHLASIHSRDENNLLKTMWKTSVSTTDGQFVWLGATDEEQEGRFVWTDGTDFDYKDWLSGQPDNPRIPNHPQNCLDLWDHPDIGWNDGACSRVYPYICKMPASLY